jgi:tetratricopeptide (TPR) repeat protein
MKKLFIPILISITVATTFIYHRSQQSDINYFKGHRYFEKRKYNAAIKLYEVALTREPAHIDALTELAFSYQWTKRYSEAIATFQKALSIKPDSIKLKIALAETYSWTGEYEKAIELYKKAIDLRESADTKRKLAEAYIWGNQPEKAKNILESMLKLNPRDSKAKLLLARSIQYSGKADEAILIYEELLAEEKRKKPEKKEEDSGKSVTELLSEAYMIKGDYDKATKKYTEILKKDPGNVEAKTGLADVYAYSKKFKKARSLYEEIISETGDIKAKSKLADLMSWDKEYKNAIKLYDDVLAEKEDPKVRLQKARVLGWAREYNKALEEYKKVADETGNPRVALEMNAKKAYWNNRVKKAIKYYNKLIEEDPGNVEAMFDLSQVYSYQPMWQKAVKMYKKIIAKSPGQFRAKEGLDKAELMSKHVLLKNGYEFFEADSPSRDNDIRKHSLFAKIKVPVRNNFRVDGDYYLTIRHFRDFNDVIENQGRVNAEYRNNPDWWLGGFYKIFVYDKNIKTMHNFGANFDFRLFDLGVSSFSYRRERLENNSTVIREHYYADTYKARVDIDIDKKLKAGLDYIFSYYSGDNYKNEPGLDVMYYFSFEPIALSIKYRYFFREFEDKVSEYFSPKGFSTNAFTVNWKHYLNKEEIFFGADDLYYDVKYAMTIDSGYIVGHKFAGAINWDINKRLNFNVRGSIVNSSTDVYNDKTLIAEIKYYF